jgi:VWFA-related protein
MFNTSDCTRAKASHPLTRVLAASAVLLCAPAPSEGRVKQPEPETVSLYLNVEKSGGLITGLDPRNFRLYADGRPAPFRLEKPEEPASIALLVEYSRSSGYYIEDLDAAMRGFLKNASGGNWYALATYSQGLTINADFTRMTGEIVDAYSGLGPPTWNEINTCDAVHEMLDKMGRLPGRRVLIVVGSGIDTFSEHTLDDVKKKIEATDVVVFAAGAGAQFRGAYEAYPGEGVRMSLLQAQSFLRMPADSSGGFAWFPNHFDAFPDVIRGAMQSIECQYRLVYQSPLRLSGKFQKIRVEALRIVNDKREDFKVLVRSGWR